MTSAQSGVPRDARGPDQEPDHGRAKSERTDDLVTLTVDGRAVSVPPDCRRTSGEGAEALPRRVPMVLWVSTLGIKPCRYLERRVDLGPLVRGRSAEGPTSVRGLLCRVPAGFPSMA